MAFGLSNASPGSQFNNAALRNGKARREPANSPAGEAPPSFALFASSFRCGAEIDSGRAQIEWSVSGEARLQRLEKALAIAFPPRT